MAESLPDASTKLRTVLDYLPCEACLSQPVKEQDLLCGVCRRLDRQVGVRIAVRRTVLLERPSEPEPVVIQPPAPEPEPEPPAPVAAPAPPVEAPLDVVLVEAGAEAPEPRPGVPQVVLEPLVEAPPAPVVAAEPEEPEFDDIVGWVPPSDAFEYVPPAKAAPPPAREPEPAPVAAVPQDDYVFQPPAAEEPAPAPAEPRPEEDWLPTEEVPVEAAEPERSPWARPAEAAEAAEEAPIQAEIVEEVATEAAEEILDMEVVADEPEPPAGGSDLWRLRGFDAAAEAALAREGVTEVQHLAGRDAAGLAASAGLAPERVAAWVHVADLVQEASVPMDAATSLVAAGVAGPRGLREMDAETVVERVQAFAGASLALSDVKRWKRRV